MAGLDDFPDLTWSIDDAMDEAELLPNRYLKKAKISHNRLI
jgi:hypothetical protein